MTRGSERYYRDPPGPLPQGSRHTVSLNAFPQCFCVGSSATHLHGLRLLHEAPRQCISVVIVAKRRRFGISRIDRGSHPLRCLPRVPDSHRICRLPARKADSRQPRNLGAKLCQYRAGTYVSHSSAPSYPHTDEVGGQRKPIWLGGVVQDKHSINNGRSSVVACGPDDPLVLVELNLGQIDL